MARPIDIATALAAQGFPVFPCSRKKTPAIAKKDGGQGFIDACTDETQVKTLFFKVPRAALVGVPTGAVSGFDVLDVDPRHGGGEWEAENRHRIPDTRVHQSMSGGRHYLFRHAHGVRNSASKQLLAPGIDIRGDGGYVIFPPSTGYTVINDTEPCDWPDWLLELVLARPHPETERPSSQTAAEISDKRLKGLTKSIVSRVSSAADGQKHVVLRNAAISLGGIVQAAGLSPDDAVRMLLQALPSSVQDWENAQKTAAWGIQQGMAKPLDLPDRPEYQPRFARQPEPEPDLDPEPEPQGNVVPICAPKAERQDWRAGWHRSDNGSPLPNFANVLTALRQSPDMHGMLRYDEMRQCATLETAIPNTPPDSAIPRPLSDADILAVQEHIQHLGLHRASKETVRDACDLHARQNAYHPVRDYLRGLKWDGTKRIDKWLSYYLGAESDDPGYLAAVGSMFLIAMVARVMQPGCQSDHMIILEGGQGIRKSTACRILSGGWFSDTMPDLAKGDAVRISMHLRGKWLIEIAELSSFSAAESHTLKEFLTQREEKYIAKYGHKETAEPRQCTFIGSTNEATYLRDPTGARRFWPVLCGNIDIDALTADRDQLFAEAMVAYCEGRPWWPDREFEAATIKPQQAARYDQDAWSSIIENWLRREYIRSVTVTEILTSALSFAPHQINRSAEMRSAAILKQLGWEQKRTMRNRNYMPPDGWIEAKNS